jgi:hypothetical protein
MKKQLTLETQKVSKLSQYEKSAQNGKITPMLSMFWCPFTSLIRK